MKINNNVLKIIISFLIGIIFWRISKDWNCFNDFLIDSYLAYLLIETLSVLSGFLITLTGYECLLYNDIIMIPNTQGMRLLYGCLGISHLILMFFLIISFPGNLKIKLIFIISALLLILLLNAVRLSGIALIMVKYPDLSEWGHYYFTRVIIYSGIFYLWIFYINIVSKIKIRNG